MSSSAEIYNHALDMVKENRRRRIEGLHNSIPFTFSRFNRVIPGIQKSNYTLLSAGTGIGKSKFAKQAYCYDAVDFIMKRPESGVKLKIFWFALEESKQAFMHSMMVMWLYREKGVYCPIKNLKSMNFTNDNEDVIPEEYIHLLESDEAKEWAEKFLECVEVIDDIRHPTGVYSYVRSFCENNGRWTMKDKEFNISGEVVVKQVHDRFIPNDSELYCLVVIDHISLVSRDGEANVRIGLFFNGGVNHFKELPKSSNMTSGIYNELLREAKKEIPQQGILNFS
jgi:hypothetical protein